MLKTIKDRLNKGYFVPSSLERHVHLSAATPLLACRNKKCSICGKQIKVIRYQDHSYRGGHYFGKVELYTKKEESRACKFGAKTKIIYGIEIHVARKDPKPYGFFEYWECPRCYWDGK